VKKPGPSFQKRLGQAGEKVLALDYDGTLAPFRKERMEAVPLPGVMETLAKIAQRGDTRVAVISGRPLDELDRLMGKAARRFVIFGAHGWESRRPGGAVETAKITKKTADALERAQEKALDAAAGLLGPGEAKERIERKAAGVAAHVRGMDREKAGEWLRNLRKEWEDLAGAGLELIRFDGGLEIRAEGKNKGDSIKTLARMFPKAGLMVYIGDDRTDEDAFKALRGKGVGIKVGKGPSAAGYYLDDCNDVLNFLKEWAKARPLERNSRDR